MSKELIIIKQLPIIEEQLKELAETIDLKCETLSYLEVNEETVKEVKKIKAEFNKELKAMEDKRKEIKTQVLAPYEAFEKTYNELVKNKYQTAEAMLNDKIKEVENKLKAEKEKEIKAYLKKTNDTFADYEDMELNILLSNSVKSYCEEIDSKLEHIKTNVKAIEGMEYASEILVEYKENQFNLARAISAVKQRHEKIDEIKTAVQVADVKHTEILAEDTAEANEEHTFTVISTKKQYDAIVEYIKKIGAKIETIDW